MKKTNLLYSFSGVAAIFFPVGRLKNGGTCEFLSKRCENECAAFKNGTMNNSIPYKTKLRIYNEIFKNPMDEIIKRIISEMTEMDTKILYWFASGDCPRKLTQKLSELIIRLSKEYVMTQQGFTRNKKLWQSFKGSDNIRFCLTIENEDKISNIDEEDKEGTLFAVPNYETGNVKIIGFPWVISKPQFEYHCGSLFNPAYRNKTHTYYERTVLEVSKCYDCQKCYNEKKGCHSKLDGTVKTNYSSAARSKF